MEKQEISYKQFGSVWLSVLIGYYIVLSLVQKGMYQDAWISTLVALILGCFIVLLYWTWLKCFGTSDWGQIFHLYYGRNIGNFIIFLYGMFFLFICVFMVWFVAFFWDSIGMNNTPHLFYIIATMLLILCLNLAGIEILARFISIVAIITSFGFISDCILLFKEMDWHNLLPVAQANFNEFSQTTLLMSIGQYGDLVVCLPFLMYVNNIKRAARRIWSCTLLGGLLLVIVIMRNIMVLGTSKYIYTVPAIQALKLIDFGDIFSRVEILGVIYIMLICLSRCAIGFSASVISMQKAFNIKNSKISAVPLAVLSVVLSYNLFFSPEEINLFFINYYCYAGIIFAILIPGLTLFLYKIFGKKAVLK